jgi:hypothetical protein
LIKGQRPGVQRHERRRGSGTRTLHDNRHQNPDPSENPLPTKPVSANGIEVPRNAFHPGLKIFDPDEEQSEASKDGSDRARFALGDQPEKGADPEHR